MGFASVMLHRTRRFPRGYSTVGGHVSLWVRGFSAYVSRIVESDTGRAVRSLTRWPKGKFAFTVVDDTDNSTVHNVKPVYDLLRECGLRTTKTVWVYPPRDNFSGQCLQDGDYREFIYELREDGFEIALHNVGSGAFTRDEILRGVEEFRELMGFYPTMQINHASNPDNLYWGVERFTGLVSSLMKLMFGDRRVYQGNNPESEYFWGDVAKKHVKFIRNHTFNGINTLRYDPRMPYRVRHKDKYSNYWFSSSDGHTIEEFNALTDPKNVLKLEEQGGLCIVYTHFASGFVKDSGKVDPIFERNIRFLASRDGWFAPAGEILDYLLSREVVEFASRSYLARFWMLYGYYNVWSRS